MMGVLLSREEFHTIKTGDTVLWWTPSGVCVEREVVEACVFGEATRGLRFRKIRTSKFPGPHTYYLYNDVKHRVTLKK